MKNVHFGHIHISYEVIADVKLAYGPVHHEVLVEIANSDT